MGIELNLVGAVIESQRHMNLEGTGDRPLVLRRETYPLFGFRCELMC
jgi:hypothetical protein